MSSRLEGLNREVVRQQLTEHDLKRWWVAERVGVHKTTLRRWLSGKIVRIRGGHLEKLAEVLALPSHELVQPEDL